MIRIKLGPIQKKLLLLLAGGLSFALAYGPKRQFKVLEQIGKEWEKIDKQALQKSIRSLYRTKLVDIKERSDGLISLTLSKEGKKKVLNFKIDEIIVNKPKKWDGIWRMVIFDVPESFKKTREAFRYHLTRLGFYKLQKSVFVFPYPCEDEIEFLIEFYNMRPYIRQITATKIDTAPHLKEIFKL